MSDAITPKALQIKLRALVDREGLRNSSKKLGISHSTITRMLAGLEVRSATITHVQARLEGGA
jgi:hypothetical protein